MFNNVEKKEAIAMILAGGQGSRLGVLTDTVAKPALPFGGKYRIIDFPLSNCINSGIDTIGVLTQYQPLELNTYIGNGQPWDLDRLYGGVSILSPRIKGDKIQPYKGTANAIYQNMLYIEHYSPEYVIVLSGDHIYKMNYKDMLNFHKEKNADCTIASLCVSIEEASRFGVLNTDENRKVYEFEEKPAAPKSNLASMGIYIFTWKKLREYLIKDERDQNSKNDFGKNVLPAMLEAGERLYAYEHKGYWKDVGTIESLWQANMDLLNFKIPVQLDNPPWTIYSRNSLRPPRYIGDTETLKNVYISEGCNILGKVNNSIIFPGVTIEEGAVVSNSVVMPGAKIDSGVAVNYTIVAPGSKIGSNTAVEYGEELTPGSRQITVIGTGMGIS